MSQNQKLSQGLLIAYYRSFSQISAGLREAKKRFSSLDLPGGFKGFSGHSKFFKDLASLPHDSDYSLFEKAVKRRLVRIQHRIHGHKENYGRGLLYHAPVGYKQVFDKHEILCRQILQRLANVDIKSEENHEHLMPVSKMKS